MKRNFVGTLRTCMGLTQEELAAHLDTSREVISRWERGCNHPNRSNREQLLSLFSRLEERAKTQSMATPLEWLFFLPVKNPRLKDGGLPEPETV